MIRPLLLRFPSRLTIALSWLVLSVMLDLTSTYLALAGHNAHEGNPLAAHFLASSFLVLVLAKLAGLGITIGIAFFLVATAPLRLVRLYTFFIAFFAAIIFFIGFSNLSAAFFGLDFFSAFIWR